MACSVCKQMGHKKPNCPVVKEEQKEQQQQLITILQTIPLILSNPLIIALAWHYFMKMNVNASLLGKLIAIGEFIPTLDLNLPKGVTLASMLNFVTSSAEIMAKIQELLDSPEILEEIKEDVNIVNEITAGAIGTTLFPAGTFVKFFSDLIPKREDRPEEPEKHGKFR